MSLLRRKLLCASIGSASLLGLAAVAAGRSMAAIADRSGLRLHVGAALAFGTTVSIKVLHEDETIALAAIEHALQQVREIDALMSLQRSASQVSQLNQRGVLETAHPHLLQVLNFSRQLSGLTQGAFDVTVQPLWQAFSSASAQGRLPTAPEIALAKSRVDWRRLEITPQRLHLTAPDMAMTLNGVAQGYAVDVAMAALRSCGAQDALLDTGEFGAIGQKAANRPWLLGIADPRQPDALSATLAMDGRSVATSGDYETFFSPDFVYHHIFDPATGRSPTELAGVTVVAPSGLWADGLSTAFMVMGADKALALTAQLPGVDVLLIHKDGAVRKSPQFPQWVA